MANLAGLCDAVLDMGYGWTDVIGEGHHNPLDHNARHLKNKLDRHLKKLIMSNNGDGMTITQLNENFMFYKVGGAHSREGINGRSGIGEKALHVKVTNNQGKVLILSSPDDEGMVYSLELDYANTKVTNSFVIHAQEASRRNEELYREYNGKSKGTVKILDVAESVMPELETLFESKKATDSILYQMSLRLYDYLKNGVIIEFQTDDGAIKPLVTIPPAYINNPTKKTVTLEMWKKGDEERYYYKDTDGNRQFIVDGKFVNVGINGADTSKNWGALVTTIVIVLEHTKWETRLQRENEFIKELGLDELEDTPANRQYLSQNTIKRDNLVIHQSSTEDSVNLRNMNSNKGSFHLDTTHEIRYKASDYTDRHLFKTQVNKSKLDLSEIYKPLMRQFGYHRTRYINKIIKSTEDTTVVSGSVRRESITSGSSVVSDANDSIVSDSTEERLVDVPVLDETAPVRHRRPRRFAPPTPPPVADTTVPTVVPAPVQTVGPEPQPMATTVQGLTKEWEQALGSGNNLEVVREPNSEKMKFMYRRRIHGDVEFTAWVLLGAVRYLCENRYHIPVEACSIEWYVPETRYDEVVGKSQSAIREVRNGERMHIVKI
jgi:hypothetical protein